MEQNTNTFTIYRDGKLDRLNAFKAHSSRFISKVGYVAYVTIETAANVADELLESAHQEFDR